MSSESVEGTEKVQALLIFSLAEEWKQVLHNHGCAFGVHEEYAPNGVILTLSRPHFTSDKNGEGVVFSRGRHFGSPFPLRSCTHVLGLKSNRFWSPTSSPSSRKKWWRRPARISSLSQLD
jgi:hypothetical protein